ncbi:DNA gyrase subunit A [Anaerolineales bacterium HSG24]|nr:DNA gyrase subunit A [Anaerolineales bacterium HSG24]
MNIGTIYQVDINQQMQKAYLDYAMSVIVSRALPDVRDGLKPVHRRILYAMHDMRLQANQPYKKSARIVGEVLGKYHPHGDAAVYDAMARMAQDFSMRMPLIDGQGNFGSVDGDRPAAMRYTEARLTSLANEIMADIDQNTVNFVDNFDGSLTEPNVVPTKFPNFLVNGATGIAVGMATSVPPHNLQEVCNALMFMIEQKIVGGEVTVDELLQFVAGPDFPTGGIIHRYGSGGRKKTDEQQVDHLKSAYAVGKGRITVQAKVHIEEMSRNRHRLVITELPYQTNKASLVEKIANLARDEKIEGIADLRDESDRHGMRLVIELTRMVEPKAVLKKLFKMTPLQSTFSINMLALVDGEPTLVSLKRALQLFIEHREEIITRRTEYELSESQKRLHILEGLRIALANLQEVVQVIINSRSADSAKNNLRKKFKLSDEQATAILNIPLRRLAALERKKIETEYKDVVKRIKELENILSSTEMILTLIKKELTEIKADYKTPRYSTILDEPIKPGEIITADDLIPDEAVMVAISRQGQICRWPMAEHVKPARSRHDDPLHVATLAQTRDALCMLTERGQAIIAPMHQIPVGTAPGQGINVAEFVENGAGTVITALPLGSDEQNSDNYLFLVSAQGRVKRVALSDLNAVRGSEATVMGLDKGDKLVAGFVTSGEGEIVLVSKLGQAIRFTEAEVRPMGLSAVGVRGMRLSQNDQIIGADFVRPKADLLVVTKQGVGKRTSLQEYLSQGRYGQGVATIALTLEGDTVVSTAVVDRYDRVMLISKNRFNKTNYAKTLPTAPRFAAGQPLISLRGRDYLVGLVVVKK